MLGSVGIGTFRFKGERGPRDELSLLYEIERGAGDPAAPWIVSVKVLMAELLRREGAIWSRRYRQGKPLSHFVPSDQFGSGLVAVSEMHLAVIREIVAASTR